MESKIKKTSLNKTLNIVIIFFIIVLLNFIFYKINFRVDITENKIFSLSKGTKKILSKIKENLFIEVYYSKELPVQYLNSKNYVLSLLKDYKTYSNGKIKISNIVVDSEEGRKKAIQNGISPVRFDIISKEKFEQQEGFLGIKIKYLDRTEVFPFIQDISNFEYDMSSKIKNLVNERKQKVFFINNANALTHYKIDPEVRERISANNDIQIASLEEVYKSSENIPAVFIGPSTELSEEELFYLEQIILKGNRLFLALDRKNINFESFFARDNYTGIDKFLKVNGINIKNTLISDRNSQPIQIAARQGPFIITNIVKYPYLVIAMDIDKNNPALREINALTLPFISPIEVSSASKVSMIPLIKTSKYSYARQENSYTNINPFSEDMDIDKMEKGPFVVSAILKGKFSSSFEMAPKKLKIKDYLKKSIGESFIYLITTSKIIGQNNSNPENILFFTNAISFISQDNDLLEIRPKGTGFRALKEINDNQKIIIKYANMFLPIIFVLSGGIYFYRRFKIKKEKAVKEYAS